MKRIVLVVFLCVVGLTSLGLFYDKLEQQFLPESSDMLVLNLPSDFNPNKKYESYQGPHPAMISRPVDSVSFPISIGFSGPVQPLFSGKNDYPFLCGTQRSGLGQPLVDNQNKEGIAIFSQDESSIKSKEVVGYSRDCSLATKIQYFVKDPDLNGYVLLNKKSDLTNTKTEIIRVETGTINRFIYVLAIPVSLSDSPELFDSGKWNNRLVYRFKGGVGVGRKQGYINIPKLLYEHGPQLATGYAVAFSTGTQTSNHYNIWLSEDTALRVKKQFESRYGKVLYTIGIGGSGGAIQQYLLAQNHPGIIDAAIPLYSYPDMVTQVNYALDCELMEYYFDVSSRDEKWQHWPNRRLIEGSNSLQGYKNRYGKLQGVAGYLNGDFSLMPDGASECSNGWRGPSQHINNPVYFSRFYEVSEPTLEKIDWSHWGDLRKFYGNNEEGLGRRFWENDGVQYGLNSLKSGALSIRDFIKLNKYIGGWKPLDEMSNERFWHVSGDDSLKNVSLWSHHNMTHNGERGRSLRSQGDEGAEKASYQAGLVFLGLANLPIIDMRHYLDDRLDMHHSLASFTSRKRIENAMGSSEHHLIWMSEKADKLSRRDLLHSLPINDALMILDQWLINMKTHPEKSMAENRPDAAQDKCYDQYGNVIDSGMQTWNGKWNQKEPGRCQKRFTHYSHSRLVAGGSIYDDVLICEKIPVAQAMVDGFYGEKNMKPYATELSAIFPNGVCNNSVAVNPKVSKLIKQIGASKQSLAADTDKAQSLTISAVKKSLILE